MPSYNIPEDVIGVPLFVPSANNFFTIESGGMPNGDPCLVVHGETNRDYKAYQPVQTVSPNLFKDSSVINWSMSLWLKLGTHANIATSTPLQTLLSCCTAASSAADVTSAYSGDPGLRFGLWASGTSGVFFARPSVDVTFAAGAPAAYTGNLPVNTWTLVVITLPTIVLAQSYLNENVAPSGQGQGSNFGGGTWSAVNTFFFCIGAYSDNAAHNGREGQWRIGKLAFHNHVLNATERSLLYHAMVG